MNNEDVSVHIVLAGVKEPNLKNKELLEKYNAVTPAELVKKCFCPVKLKIFQKQ